MDDSVKTRGRAESVRPSVVRRPNEGLLERRGYNEEVC